MKVILIAAAALALVGASALTALADPVAPTPEATAEAAAPVATPVTAPVATVPVIPPPPAKKICRTDETVSSFIPRRICKTKAEWAEIDEADRLDAERLQNQMQNGPARNGRF